MAAACDHLQALRLLLIGRTGQGKSHTGNSLVGCDVFAVSDFQTSETQTRKWSEQHKYLGRLVEVVDTPGIFDTNRSHAEIQKELIKAMALLTPGFHAIAYVLRRGERITEEFIKTQELFIRWFGPNAHNFTFIILTQCETEDMMERYLHLNPHQELIQLLSNCSNRVVGIENSSPKDLRETQVKQVWAMVETIQRQNNNQHYTNVIFELTETYIRDKMPKRLTNDSFIYIKEAVGNNTFSQKHYPYLDQRLGEEVPQDEKVSIRLAATNIDQSDVSSNESIPDDGNSSPQNKPINNELYERGNLNIFDNATNEKIQNTFKIRSTSFAGQVEKENNVAAKSKSCSKVQSIPTVTQLPAVSNICENDKFRMHESLCSVEKGSDIEMQKQVASAKHTDQKTQQYPSQPINRVINSDEDESRNIFKNGINGENVKQLNLLSRFIIQCWRRLKLLFHGLTTLLFGSCTC